MSTGYKKKELEALFDQVEVVDKEIEAYRYYLALKNNLTFILSISPYDEFASISLWRKDLESWIFDIGVNNLAWIICDKNSVKLYKDENKKKVSVFITIKPKFFLQCDAF